jgi:uncharacterized protein (DUF4415 family)
MRFSDIPRGREGGRHNGRRTDRGDCLQSMSFVAMCRRCAYALNMRKKYDFSHGKRGAVVPTEGGKTRITIRLDADILDWFRDQVNNMGGGNYQTMINNALRQHVQERKEPIEKTLRRVIREELKKHGIA